VLHNQQTGLTPEKLQLFLAGLSGLSGDEVRKAKLLFIRNEVSQLKALKASMAGIGVAQAFFAIIPIFWPIFWAQRSGMNAALTLQKDQIRNALSVWRDDLGGDAKEIEMELDAL
jgi:hypothetical protein